MAAQQVHMQLSQQAATRLPVRACATPFKAAPSAKRLSFGARTCPDARSLVTLGAPRQQAACATARSTQLRCRAEISYVMIKPDGKYDLVRPGEPGAP